MNIQQAHEQAAELITVFLPSVKKKLHKRDKTRMLENEAPSFKLQLLNVNNE